MEIHESIFQLQMKTNLFKIADGSSRAQLAAPQLIVAAMYVRAPSFTCQLKEINCLKRLTCSMRQRLCLGPSSAAVCKTVAGSGKLALLQLLFAAEGWLLSS